MITRIGLAAGDVWNYLDVHSREARLSDLIVALKRDRDIVLMAIGWLAREGHVVLDGAGPDYIVRLG